MKKVAAFDLNEVEDNDEYIIVSQMKRVSSPISSGTSATVSPGEPQLPPVDAQESDPAAHNYEPDPLVRDNNWCTGL